MQFSLLTQTDEKKMKRDYRHRMLTVALFMASIAGLIGIVAAFPSFMLADLQKNDALSEQQKFASSKEKSGVAALRKEFLAEKALLAVLNENISNPRLSSRLEKVVGLRKENSIDSLAVSFDNATSSTIQITGVAPNRNALIAFRDRLLSELPGSTVDLPLSSLAKGNDIRFAIRIVQPIK